MPLKYISILTIINLFLGCTPNEIHSVQSSESLKDFTQDINKTGMSSPIILLGDTQEHEDYGRPTNEEKRIIDNLVDVTKRTVQANLNAIEILDSIIKEHGEKPIIHLGDFLDVSCHDEFTRAINVLSQHDKWIVMLGNHDGYYIGNFLKKEISNKWAERCDSGRFYKELNITLEKKSGEFDNSLLDEINKWNNIVKNEHVRSYNKSTVIERYLSTLFRKNREINNTIAYEYSKIFDNNNSFKETSETGEYFSYQYSGDKNKTIKIIDYQNSNKDAFIKKIYAYVNQCKIKSDLQSCNPQKSFLLQKVSLKEKEIELILLDTSVYEEGYASEESGFFKLLFNITKLPGKKGHLTSDKNNTNQLEIVEKWIKENNENNITTLFAGHHPLEDTLELKDFFKTNNLFKNKPIFYISAHTHKGFWKRYKENHLTELNIGSLIDAPIHYRTLQVKIKKDNMLEVFSELKNINSSNVQEFKNKSSCKEEWKDYSKNEYKYANPTWQINEYKFVFKNWKSKDLILLPYLSYYLKFLETDEAEKFLKKFKVSFYTLDEKDREKDFNRLTLIAYLKKSISNFEKKIKGKENNSIDNNNSCIKYINNKISTRDCSNLLYFLKKDEKKIFKELNETFFSTYKMCTALNAIEIDDKKSIFEFGLKNRRIENVIVK